MAHIPTEDDEYLIDDFALDDEQALDGTIDTSNDDEMTVETKLIQELRKYLKEAEAEHNSFDIIDLTEQAKMTPTQQIAVHKCVVTHLRNMRAMINNKVREN